MADTSTPTYSFTLIEVGASENTWGGKTNDNWDLIEDLLDGTSNLTGNFASTGNPTFSGAVGLSGAVSFTGSATFAGITIADLGTVTTADINGGTADGVVLGGTTPAAATVTDLTSSGAVDFSAITNKATFRSDIGVVGESEGQPIDAGLTSIAALTTAADKALYTTAHDVYATFDLTSYARTLLDDADEAAMRTTLGLGTAATTASTAYATAVQGTTADNAMPKAGGTFTGGVTFEDEIVENVYSLTGTAIDPANGTIQVKTLAANTTFTESLADGESVALWIDDGTAYSVTWPTMTWLTRSGSAPALAASGYNVFVLTKQGGTLYGFIGRAD